MEMNFYKCNKCGQIAAIVKKTAAPLVCCGENMIKMQPHSSGALAEKHMPIIERKSDSALRVSVSTFSHPMAQGHHIEWIALQTLYGNQRKELKQSESPFADFAITSGDKPICAYAFCNLHGLWKTEV